MEITTSSSDKAMGHGWDKAPGVARGGRSRGYDHPDTIPRSRLSVPAKHDSSSTHYRSGTHPHGFQQITHDITAHGLSLCSYHYYGPLVAPGSNKRHATDLVFPGDFTKLLRDLHPDISQADLEEGEGEARRACLSQWNQWNNHQNFVWAHWQETEVSKQRPKQSFERSAVSRGTLRFGSDMDTKVSWELPLQSKPLIALQSLESAHSQSTMPATSNARTYPTTAAGVDKTVSQIAEDISESRAGRRISRSSQARRADTPLVGLSRNTLIVRPRTPGPYGECRSNT
jgi:hypothetical protein